MSGIAVLGRETRVVVRATADNPAVDIDAPARVVSMILESDADHVVERDLPYGAAVEGVSTAALREAGRRAVAPSDREHVTPFITRRHTEFRTLSPSAPIAIRRPDLRFSVDLSVELEYMRRVFTEAGDGSHPIPLVALVRAADRLASKAEVA